MWLVRTPFRVTAINRWITIKFPRTYYTSEILLFALSVVTWTIQGKNAAISESTIGGIWPHKAWSNVSKLKIFRTISQLVVRKLANADLPMIECRDLHLRNKSKAEESNYIDRLVVNARSVIMVIRDNYALETLEAVSIAERWGISPEFVARRKQI
jgi:hypothetical protein